MKRMLVTTTMSAMFALAAPGLAAAAHHSDAHHAKRSGVRSFGSLVPSGSSSHGASDSTETPPSTPPSGPGETAGTVTSFTGGVLTITLNNGSTVSGQVNEQTEIHCQSSTSSSTGGDDQGEGDSEGGGGPEGGDGGSSTRGAGADAVSRNDGRAATTEGEDGSQGDSGDDSQSCTTAALVAGTVVREAELSLGSSGAVWDHVDLIQ
jgi:hypothetical protein